MLFSIPYSRLTALINDNMTANIPHSTSRVQLQFTLRLLAHPVLSKPTESTQVTRLACYLLFPFYLPLPASFLLICCFRPIGLILYRCVMPTRQSL